MFFDLSGGQSGVAQFQGNELEALNKALEMGYGTDAAALTGGAALRIQSLDQSMQVVVQEKKHFTLFNKLAKPKIGTTVDEWTEQNDIGGFMGSSTNTEAGIIPLATGEYERKVGQVKYLMDRREVSVVSTLANNIVNAQTAEQMNSTRKLLGDANYFCYAGDAAVVPTQFDGISTLLRNAVAAGQIDPDHVVDMRGGPLNSIEPFNRAAAVIGDYGNFGSVTDVFWSNSVQSDMDSALDPAFRIALDRNPEGTKLGAPVTAIRLSQGDVVTNKDVFILDDRKTMPFEAQGDKLAAVATSNAAMQPTLAVANAASDANSRFEASHAGQYYYMVCGVSSKGESTGVVSSQVAIAAGEKRVLTITASVGGGETGYAIYRSRKNGSNAAADLRLVVRIPKAGATTVWTDLNILIPGTTEAFLLNLAPSDTAMLWRQMLPLFRFDLFPTNAPVVPWAQILGGYLRVSKLRHHAKFTNILPNSAKWKPFG